METAWDRSMGERKRDGATDWRVRERERQKIKRDGRTQA